MSTLDGLLNELFDSKRPPLYYDFAGWARESRRYRSFAQENRGKIRAKIARIRNADEAADLRAELFAASMLLGEDSLTLEYEKLAAQKQRGPDFTATWKTHTPVHIEVRRLRSAELDLTDVDARATKLIHILADKIGQTLPSAINLLWMVTEVELAEQDIARAMQFLREIAGQKVEEYFARRGYRSASDFLKRYQQLSAVAVVGDAPFLWQNPAAKHKLAPQLVNAVARIVQGR